MWATRSCSQSLCLLHGRRRLRRCRSLTTRRRPCISSQNARGKGLLLQLSRSFFASWPVSTASLYDSVASVLDFLPRFFRPLLCPLVLSPAANRATFRFWRRLVPVPP